MFLKQRRLFSDAFWVLSGQLASAVALLAGTRILTELVTPEIYGQVALLNGFIALGVAVFSYPFICAGMRLSPEYPNNEERARLHGVVSGLTVRATVWAIALLMIGGFAYHYMTQTDIYLLALTGMLLAVTVRRELGIQLLIGERKQRGASLWQTSDSILRPLLAITLVVWLGQMTAWVLLGYILASLIANAVGSFIQLRTRGKLLNPFLVSCELVEPQHRKLDQLVQKTLKSEVWAYALPLIPMELIFWVNGLGDRYVIGYFMTAADVGLYAATYMVINEAFNRSAMVLLRIFQPVYFQACSLNETTEGFRILWLWIGWVVVLGVAGVSLLLMTGDWVAALVLAKSYHSAVELMPAIAAGCALHALGTVLAQPLLAKKRTQSLLKGRVCGVVVAAISVPLMVKYYGLPGAAIANPVYFGIEALVLALLAKPWWSINPEHKNYINQGEEKISSADAAA